VKAAEDGTVLAQQATQLPLGEVRSCVADRGAPASKLAAAVLRGFFFFFWFSLSLVIRRGYQGSAASKGQAV
jgi:hypothetical protein